MGFCKVLTKDSWVTTMILHRIFLTKGSCVSEKVLKRGELGIYRSIKKGNLSICKVLKHNSWESVKGYLGAEKFYQKTVEHLINF